ncbi:MAG: V-type ATP synthase subunit F [bacterium]|nr:V-type ATP synthase subunit F [bacterium]
MKIGIIGKKETVIGFRALGVVTYFVKNKEEAEEKIGEISKDDLAMLFIPESLAQEIYPQIQKLNAQTFPAVTIIPDPAGSTGFASRIIRDAMLRAVGTDVTKA